MSTSDITARKYLFALVDGGGTVPPELGAVRRLVDRGHHVTVLGEDSMVADVRASGAQFRPWTEAPNRASRLAEDDPYHDWECKTPMALFARVLDRQFVGPAPSYAADVTAAIGEDRPDLVVCSLFALGAMVAAEAAGIPFDVLLPNMYLLPTAGMPPIGVGLRPAKGRLGRSHDRLITNVLERQWRKGLAPINELHADHGLAPLDSFWDQVHHAHRELVLTSPAFDFPAELRSNVRYVGAVLDDPAWAATADWEAPPGDDPLVLVALSSTFQDHAACLQRIVDGLARLPVRGLVTTGPALDPGAITAPPNVTIVRAAPHSKVLATAASGGHPRRPRHGRASAGGRRADGDPAARAGPGRRRGTRHRTWRRGRAARGATPRRIAKAVQRVLADPDVRVNAEHLGEAIRRDAAAGRLVAELETAPTSAPSRRCAACRPEPHASWFAGCGRLGPCRAA